MFLKFLNTVAVKQKNWVSEIRGFSFVETSLRKYIALRTLRQKGSGLRCTPLLGMSQVLFQSFVPLEAKWFVSVTPPVYSQEPVIFLVSFNIHITSGRLILLVSLLDLRHLSTETTSLCFVVNKC